MATIIRDDNVQFVLQSYRERFTQPRRATLKQELRLLAQTNGQYVCLLKSANKQIEAVFSKDSGYLLGETVWHYFSKPRDLIFCEALDGEHALMVIVRGGMVHLDAKLPLNAVEHELLSLASERVRFDIKVYGNVPALLEPDGEQPSVLTQQQVQSFERLEDRVLPRLQKIADLQLLTLDQALQGLKANTTRWGWFSVATIATVLFAWWLCPGPSPQSHLPLALTPAQRIQLALHKPLLSEQLTAVQKSINQLLALPGWSLTDIKYQADKATFEMHTFGGATNYIRHWGQQHDYQVQLNQQGTEVVRQFDLSNRPTVVGVPDAQVTLSHIVDRMMRVLPGKSVWIGKPQRNTAYNQVAVNINFNGVSSGVLSLMGKMLSGLPVTLQAAAIHVNNGLLSGKVELIVIGT